MNFSAIMQYIISGFTKGSEYSIIALGFTLVYNTCDIINFAQGEFVMLGGMAATLIFFKGLHLSLLLSIILAVLLVTAIGGLLARTTVYPLKKEGSLALIIVTIGLSNVIRGAAMGIWGKDAQILPSFASKESINLWGASIQSQCLWIISIAILIMLFMMSYFKLTVSGRAMRACAINKTGARICGINPAKMMIYSFMLSAALGAATGVIIAPLTMTSYDVGIMLGLKGFCAAIIGGLSSFAGAIVGGLFLGMAESFGAVFCQSEFKNAIAFFLLLLILFVKPSGILGSKENEK